MKKSKNIEEIKEYIIDKIEENIIVCENSKTKKMENIDKKKLKIDINEGDIIKFVNGKYIKDDIKTKKRAKEIKSKMDQLWN